MPDNAVEERDPKDLAEEMNFKAEWWKKNIQIWMSLYRSSWVVVEK